jgi:hypothetical protein
VEYKGTCCSTCRDTVQLPEDEQKKLRRGVKDSAKIFNKARLRDALKRDHLNNGRSSALGVRLSEKENPESPEN